MVMILEIAFATVCAVFVAWRLLKSNLFRARRGDPNGRSRSEGVYDDLSGFGGPAGGGLG